MENKTLQPGHKLVSNEYVYVIEKVLGRGGFGITYLASTTIRVGNVEMPVRFAIKEHFINSDCERETGTYRVVYSAPAKERVENSLKDFISEAVRLQKVGVGHKNIVSVNEIFQANNTAYYVMEYLDGESLRSYLSRKGKLSEKEVLDIMLPVLDAVSALHERNMTHLDIKPDNIMIVRNNDGELRPVLIDFGLSKHYSNDGSPTSTINTLGCSDGYSPVEQYLGITTFSPTADIYALGATVYYCLTGQNPKKAAELREGELADNLRGLATDKTIDAVRRATKLSKFDREHKISNLYGSSSNSRPKATFIPETPVPERHSASTVAINNKKTNSSNKNIWLLCLAVGFLFALIYIALNKLFTEPEHANVPIAAHEEQVVEESPKRQPVAVESAKYTDTRNYSSPKNDYFNRLSRSELRQEIKDFIISYYDAIERNEQISFFEDEGITFFSLKNIDKETVRKNINKSKKRETEHYFDWSSLNVDVLSSGYAVATFSSDYYIHYDTKIDQYLLTTEIIISPEFKIKSVKDTRTQKVNSVPIEY